MNIQQLQKYKHLKKEWADLSARVAEETEADSVYVHQLCTLQAQQLALVQKELMDMELFLTTIEESEIRNIIRYYYMDGLTWAATATKLYGYPCADRPRLKLNRYFKKRGL